MPVIVVLVPVIVVLVAVIVVLMPVVVVLVPVIVAAVILFFFTPPLRATGAYRGGTAEQKQEHPDSHFPMAHAPKEHARSGYANCLCITPTARAPVHSQRNESAHRV